MNTPQMALPQPPRYVPFISGTYTLTAGLHTLERSFGNAAHDGHVFQFDSLFGRFRANLARIRERSLADYLGMSSCSDDVLGAVAEFMMHHLVKEHPEYFRLETDSASHRLTCLLTKEILEFDTVFALRNARQVPYESAFDALASQVQEDLAIVVLEEGRDRLAAVHVTAPGFWEPVGKLDLGFIGVHEPVPGMEALNRNATSIMKAMTQDARYQRFAWGISTDTELDHHPKTAIRRPFDPANPALYVRVERQAIVGLPSVSAFLFCIHPYFIDCATLSTKERISLVSALKSMSPETRRYKGLNEAFDDIEAWLTEGI